MDIPGYMLTTVMIVCAAWLVGLVTKMDASGVVVERLKSIANVQEARNSFLNCTCVVQLKGVLKKRLQFRCYISDFSNQSNIDTDIRLFISRKFRTK